MNDGVGDNGDNNMDNSDGTSQTSNTDYRGAVVDEANSEHSIREETLRVAPDGCNVYYGTYIDNYNNGIRSRYYYDSYGQLVLANRQTGNRPSGAVCTSNTDELMSYNADIVAVGIWVIVAVVIAKVATMVAGRLIK